MIHELKVKALFYELLIKGTKTFELRKDDRNYKVGDYLALNEIALTENDDVPFPDDDWEYTGRSTLFQITHIFGGGEFLQPGYVALGIKPCEIRLSEEPHSYTRDLREVRRTLSYPTVPRCNC